MTVDILRRAFIAGAPIAATVLGAPAVAFASTETAREKIERLGNELSLALRELDGGQWQALVSDGNSGAAVELIPVTSAESQETKVRNMVRALQVEMTKLDPSVRYAAESANFELDYQVNDPKLVRLRLSTNPKGDEDVLVGFLPRLDAGHGNI